MWYAINPADVLSAGEWYNVAATHDGSEAKIYLNGNLEESLKAGFAWSGGEVGISIPIRQKSHQFCPCSISLSG